MANSLLLGMALLLPQGLPPDELPLPGGVWRAWLDSRGGALPFQLEIESDGPACVVWVVQGGRRTVASRAAREDDTLRVVFDDFGSVLEARVGAGGTALDGTFERHDGATVTRLGFHARFDGLGAAPPAAPIAPPSGPDRSATAARCTGRYAVRFSGSDEAAVGLLREEGDGTVRGTILTGFGSPGTLTGRREGNALALFGFDGAVPVVLRATIAGESLADARCWIGDGDAVTFTAQRDANAALPDPWTRARAERLGPIALSDADGAEYRLDDPELLGRACILFVFRASCPRCHDATQALAPLAEAYAAVGLRVVGIADETYDGEDRAHRALRAYRARHDVPWPILVAGHNPGEPAAALRFLGEVTAWPTLVFVRGDGTIDAVWRGFVGPAAPAEHRAAVEGWRTRIEALLD